MNTATLHLMRILRIIFFMECVILQIQCDGIHERPLALLDIVLVSDFLLWQFMISLVLISIPLLRLLTSSANALCPFLRLESPQSSLH